MSDLISGPKASPGKWLLNYGIHRGTMMSRDSADGQEYDSEAEARAAFREAKNGYARMGYYIWFANMYDDQGNQTILEHGAPYV